MKTVNYSLFRKELKKYCDYVNQSNEEVIITRKDQQEVVLMSLEKYSLYCEQMQKILKDLETIMEKQRKED